MGTQEADKCVFCGTELEDWGYGFEENGERASSDFDKDLEICKDCLEKLKLLLGLKK